MLLTFSLVLPYHQRVLDCPSKRLDATDCSSPKFVFKHSIRFTRLWYMPYYPWGHLTEIATMFQQFQSFYPNMEGSGQRKRWEDNIREWTGLEFAKSQRAVENKEKWRKLVAKSSVVPQRPSRLRDWWWWWSKHGIRITRLWHVPDHPQWHLTDLEIIFLTAAVPVLVIRILLMCLLIIHGKVW